MRIISIHLVMFSRDGHSAPASNHAHTREAWGRVPRHEKVMVCALKKLSLVLDTSK